MEHHVATQTLAPYSYERNGNALFSEESTTARRDEGLDFGVTTLGSGGPYANAHRTSAGYCIWTGDRPALLVDAGGGAFTRIGQAEIPVQHIDTMAFTHTHIDHTGGLAPIVFAALMAKRSEPFAFAGPSGRGKHPGAKLFIDRLFGPEGAWNYLHSFKDFAYDVHEVDSDTQAPAKIYEIPTPTAGVHLFAVAVRHGMMPAIAYRVEFAGRSIVFSGDVAEESDALVELARGCDLLIHDLALPERDVPDRNLHARPSAVGRVAARAGCERLLVSHIMPELEDELGAAIAQVRAAYGGEIVEARDLFTISV